MAEALPPREIFGERVRTLRTTRKWRQEDLADRLAAFGMPFERASVAKLEGGVRTRGATVDELFAFAAALDVSPIALLVPPSDAEPVLFTPAFEATAGDIREWMRGHFFPIRQPTLGAEVEPDWKLLGLRSEGELAAADQWPQLPGLVDYAEGVWRRAVKADQIGMWWALSRLRAIAEDLMQEMERRGFSGDSVEAEPGVPAEPEPEGGLRVTLTDDIAREFLAGVVPHALARAAQEYVAAADEADGKTGPNQSPDE
jgi:transcriptional regulator with XRE-family HTH domain